MLFFVFGGMFTVFGLILIVSALAGTHPIAELPTYIVYVVIGAVLILLGVNRRRQAAKAEKLRRQQAEQRRREEEEAARLAKEAKEKIPSVTLPKSIKRAHLKYRYDDVDFVPSEDADRICEDIVESGKYELSINIDENNRIFFSSYSGERIGELVSKSRIPAIIIEYMNQGHPIRTYLTLFSSDESIARVTIAFYRDDEALYSKREHTSHRLTHCYSAETQDTILYSFFVGGETLDFEVDEDNPETIWVTYDDYRIGALPDDAAKRFAKEGNIGFYGKTEHDANGMLVPHINLYW